MFIKYITLLAAMFGHFDYSRLVCLPSTKFKLKLRFYKFLL